MSGYLSSRHINPDDVRAAAEHTRQFWASVFADGIRMARKATGRSIEATAYLAHLDIWEWTALEAGGWLPRTVMQLRYIAAALELSYDSLASFVVLCSSAWEGRRK